MVQRLLVATAGGEKRCRDAAEELMKGPVTVQETINDITNRRLGAAPHEQRVQSTGLAASFTEVGFQSQSTS